MQITSYPNFSVFSKPFFIMYLFIIFALVVDTSFVKISRFSFNAPLLSTDSLVFYFIIGLYLFGLASITRSIRPKKIGMEYQLRLVSRIMFPVQYIVAVIVLITFFQVIENSNYDPLLLKLVVSISYLQGIFVMGFLVHKFITWHLNKKSKIVLLYTMAIGGMLVNVAITLFFVNEQLSSFSSYIIPRGNTFVPYVDPFSVLTISYQVSSIISYLLTWIATAILLYNYSKRLGKIKYWTLVSLPLFYFILQFQPLLLESLLDYRLASPIYFSIIYTLFFVATKPIGGILFGMAFWSTGRKISNIQIKSALFISGYGLALFYTSNQATLLNVAPYPPFGLATTAFLGLAATLLLIGIYSVAISLAQDARLRRNVRETLRGHSPFLDNIGLSQMEQQVQKKVVHLTQKLSTKMENESGIQSSLEEGDIKDYINEVLYEIDKRKSMK
jgi:hypothetical protein